MEFLSNSLSVLLLIIGFGFVIFWHELGHFLAAKWVGIKVEQFAVGMGHALVSFRRGIGWKLGNTRAEYERRIKAHLDANSPGTPSGEYTDAQMSRAAEALGLGETEYRLSWIPIGGYVKMLGQDDLKPGADAEDPRAFNKKSVPQRMLVVSAGVIMNIILAAILFMVLFLYGFRAPAPVVGQVLAGSPAQQAGIHPGDTILAFNGQPQQDWTKISLNTALASAEEPLKVQLKRYGSGNVETVEVQPIRPNASSKAFLQLGVTPAPALEGPRKRDWPKKLDPELEARNMFAIRPGDVIKKVNDTEVGPGDYAVLDQAVQNSGGAPVTLTVQRAATGKLDDVRLTPHFEPLFGPQAMDVNVAGLQPRMRVDALASDSSVAGILKPDDVIVALGVRNEATPASQPADHIADISVPAFIKAIDAAGQKGQFVELTVLRDGKVETLKSVQPTKKIEGQFKLGVIPTFDDRNPVVGGVLPNSPAAEAGEPIQPGSVIQAVDGKPVNNWFQVRDALKAADPGAHTLTLLPPNSEKPVQRTVNLDKQDVRAIAAIRLDAPLALAELITVRKTANPLTAMGWGVLETRDLILQFYVTLQRMFGGSVSPSNLMGPLGIVNAGTKFAFKGTDWLIWFLAMISANLAVVNFLPIPIVDGGLFLFLIIEKIQGRPLSRRAQEYAQLVGLALILSVFLMVTYNDIARMFGH